MGYQTKVPIGGKLGNSVFAICATFNIEPPWPIPLPIWRESYTKPPRPEIGDIFGNSPFPTCVALNVESTSPSLPHPPPWGETERNHRAYYCAVEIIYVNILLRSNINFYILRHLCRVAFTVHLRRCCILLIQINYPNFFFSYHLSLCNLHFFTKFTIKPFKENHVCSSKIPALF